MTPESAQILGKAHRLLQETEAMLTINLNEAAGRVPSPRKQSETGRGLG